MELQKLFMRERVYENIGMIVAVELQSVLKRYGAKTG